MRERSSEDVLERGWRDAMEVPEEMRENAAQLLSGGSEKVRLDVSG